MFVKFSADDVFLYQNVFMFAIINNREVLIIKKNKEIIKCNIHI